MFTVGFGGSIHDYATAVVDENRIHIAIEDERLTRKRYAIDSEDPLKPSFEYCLRSIPAIADSSVKKAANDTLVHCPLLSSLAPVWINHHFAHAASSFYTSAFDDAIIMVADGAGSVTGTFDGWHVRETTSLFYGQGNTIKLLARVDGRKNCPALQNDFLNLTEDSIGDLYEAVTCAIGFSPLQEGKTMALAAYGDDRFVPALNERVALRDGFLFSIDLSGPNGVMDFLDKVVSGYSTKEDVPFEIKAALAYAVQYHAERLIGALLNASMQYCKSTNLCFAGGVGLNAVAMGKLPEMAPFRSVHHISAPGDSGTAIGAAIALQVSSHQDGKTLRWPWTPYLGKSYAVGCEDLFGLDVQECSTDEHLLSLICEAVLSGKIVGLFRGGSEFGPRSLGHRSLVASPEFPGIQWKLNQLKSREWFRPIAPMTLDSRDAVVCSGERWMQAARPRAGDVIKARAALHVDGSARVQLVDDNADPFLHQLLMMLRRHGVKALLNTSFNLHGEPIVETPVDAVRSFVSAPIDALAIEHLFATK